MALNLRKMRFYSGGHEGAEAEFGFQAERYGIREINFSYRGNTPHRKRGIALLSPETLKRGDISMEIVSLRMGRRYSREQDIRKVIQVIFHMVNMGHQIFSVGWIQPDDTVQGGTGWAVELGKLFVEGKHPDPTNLLLAGAAGYIGYLVPAWFVRWLMNWEVFSFSTNVSTARSCRPRNRITTPSRKRRVAIRVTSRCESTEASRAIEMIPSVLD